MSAMTAVSTAARMPCELKQQFHVRCTLYCSKVSLCIKKLFIVFLLLNTGTMDRWLKTGSLKCTLEECDGNPSVSDNCGEKCSDVTVSGQISEPSVSVLKVSAATEIKEPGL
jgi:hypothetical protein